VAIMGAEFPSWIKDELLTEDEMGRVTVELGLTGLLLVFSLRFLIAAFGLRCAKSFRNPAYRALGNPLAVYLAMGLINPIILSPTSGLYYWGTLGLVLAMRRIDQSAVTEVGTILVRRADQRTKLRPVMPMAGGAPRRPSES
jgi:hypothetical protein